MLHPAGAVVVHLAGRLPEDARSVCCLIGGPEGPGPCTRIMADEFTEAKAAAIKQVGCAPTRFGVRITALAGSLYPSSGYAQYVGLGRDGQ